MYALTRNLFPVAFEWGRLACFTLVAGGIAAAGELLLPDRRRRRASSPARSRWPRSRPRCTLARFFRPGELLAARGLLRRGRCLQPPVELLGALGEPFAAAREAASR